MDPSPPAVRTKPIVEPPLSPSKRKTARLPEKEPLASAIRIPPFMIPCSASQLMDEHYGFRRVPPLSRHAAA